jgi:hypothetical protein
MESEELSYVQLSRESAGKLPTALVELRSWHAALFDGLSRDEMWSGLSLDLNLVSLVKSLPLEISRDRLTISSNG